MSDSSHHANALVKDTTRKGNAGNDRIGKLMLLIKVLVLVASFTLGVGYFSTRSELSKTMIEVAVKEKDLVEYLKAL